MARCNIKCWGKVRRLENDLVRVSFFPKMEGKRIYNPEKEIIELIPRSYFPKDMKVGDVFDYCSSVSITIVPQKKLSDEEIESIRKKVEKRFAGYDL